MRARSPAIILRFSRMRSLKRGCTLVAFLLSISIRPPNDRRHRSRGQKLGVSVVAADSGTDLTTGDDDPRGVEFKLGRSRELRVFRHGSDGDPFALEALK